MYSLRSRTIDDRNNSCEEKEKMVSAPLGKQQVSL